jgi:hypothetical protein
VAYCALRAPRPRGERKGRRPSKKAERLATDTSLEPVRHLPRREVDHMNAPVPLAGDEERPLMNPSSVVGWLRQESRRGE